MSASPGGDLTTSAAPPAPATPGPRAGGEAFPAHARRALAWAVAVALLSAGALLAAASHGRASRSTYAPQAAPDRARVLSVRDVAEAVRVWRAAGLRGRRLVVLTGRWSRPRTAPGHPRVIEDVERLRASGGLEALDVDGALYAAARSGIARRMDVVMPPAAWATRLAEVRARKEVVLEDEAFRQPADGFERRFSTPRAFRPSDEPVLVLVEPSWFGEGAPGDPLAWLASAGARWDLALITAADPAAEAGALRSAEAYARATGAAPAEARE